MDEITRLVMWSSDIAFGPGHASFPYDRDSNLFNTTGVRFARVPGGRKADHEGERNTEGKKGN